MGTIMVVPFIFLLLCCGELLVCSPHQSRASTCKHCVGGLWDQRCNWVISLIMLHMLHVAPEICIREWWALCAHVRTCPPYFQQPMDIWYQGNGKIFISGSPVELHQLSGGTPWIWRRHKHKQLRRGHRRGFKCSKDSWIVRYSPVIGIVWLVIYLSIEMMMIACIFTCYYLSILFELYTINFITKELVDWFSWQSSWLPWRRSGVQSLIKKHVGNLAWCIWA